MPFDVESPQSMAQSSIQCKKTSAKRCTESPYQLPCGCGQLYHSVYRSTPIKFLFLNNNRKILQIGLYVKQCRLNTESTLAVAATREAHLTRPLALCFLHASDLGKAAGPGIVWRTRPRLIGKVDSSSL